MEGSLTPKEKRAQKGKKLASDKKEQEGKSLANLPTERLPEILFFFMVKFITLYFLHIS